jgi:hypothetical protein
MAARPDPGWWFPPGEQVPDRPRPAMTAVTPPDQRRELGGQLSAIVIGAMVTSRSR